MLKSPNIALLKEYRNAVFHYKKKYNDERLNSFYEAGNQIVVWVRELHDELSRFFLAEIGKFEKKP